MKIYTKTGDRGETSVIGGIRLPKHHPRIEAYGTVDELIAWIGLLRAAEQSCVTKDELITIQSVLMSCCTVIATHPYRKGAGGNHVDDTSELEKSIDRMEASLPKLTSFVLPGGHPAAAQCNIARIVCRRAERASCASMKPKKSTPMWSNTLIACLIIFLCSIGA